MLHFSRIAPVLLGAGLILGLTTAVRAQSTDLTPKYSNDFLNIGVGAEPWAWATYR
ncbi:hypothetical protein [Hymenobacter cellulosilyticus]|uniref:Uncharacterized protein n=1 Tax=Hymenobacter cellulosilyticus TaxID=2932248 RepID=A0A8T9Q6L7_9BACT|nr:hypothetical protein [Hymenobacter cellulosilyticus]UOQ71648.1 hypothetical protein MUN79_24050 [Hymenobacter cellulosilyticus]